MFILIEKRFFIFCDEVIKRNVIRRANVDKSVIITAIAIEENETIYVNYFMDGQYIMKEYGNKDQKYYLGNDDFQKPLFYSVTIG